MLSHKTFNITLHITFNITLIVLFSQFNYFPQFPGQPIGYSSGKEREGIDH